MGEYQGHYAYSHANVSQWQSNTIGVYYCGYVTAEGKLRPLYIGKGTGEAGVRGRLLDHLRDNHWPDVTAFGYVTFQTAREAEDFEATAIANHQPKYNIQLT